MSQTDDSRVRVRSGKEGWFYCLFKKIITMLLDHSSPQKIEGIGITNQNGRRYSSYFVNNTKILRKTIIVTAISSFSTHNPTCGGASFHSRQVVLTKLSPSCSCFLTDGVASKEGTTTSRLIFRWNSLSQGHSRKSTSVSLKRCS